MTFEVVDDVALALDAGRLAASSVTLTVTGRLGPLVEFHFLRRAAEARYRGIQIEANEISRLLDAAFAGRTTGTTRGAVAGFLPLAKRQPETDDPLWIRWSLTAQHAARRAGVAPKLAQSLIGALNELEDNVHMHSGAPATGIAGFAVTEEAFEVVVADAGIGILESLRQAPDVAGLTDGGEALRLALSDGISRFGRGQGRGYGFATMFTALAGHEAALRFRSGDHALTIVGTGPTLAHAVISQKAALPGFIVSILCPARGGSGPARPFNRPS